MKPLRTSTTWLIASAVLLSCAPERPAESSPDEILDLRRDGASAVVVASVEGREITRAMFEDELHDLEPWAARRYMSDETRPNLLNALVVMLTLAHHAELEGMLDDPRVTHALREELAQHVLDAELRARGVDTVAEDALRTAYDTSPPEAMSQPMRRGLIIAGASREVAKAWREEIMAGGQERASVMMRIAREGSMLPNRLKGGAIDFTPPPNTQSSDPAVIEALFALKAPGDVSDVIVSGDFFWLVMFQQERAPTKLPYAQVSEALRTKLMGEQRQNTQRALLDELRANTTIEIFPEALAKARAPK